MNCSPDIPSTLQDPPNFRSENPRTQANTFYVTSKPAETLAQCQCAKSDHTDYDCTNSDHTNKNRKIIDETDNDDVGSPETNLLADSTFVRAAELYDAPTIAKIQQESYLWQLKSSLQNSTNSSQTLTLENLPAELKQLLDLDSITTQWQQTLANMPDQSLVLTSVIPFQNASSARYAESDSLGVIPEPIHTKKNIQESSHTNTMKYEVVAFIAAMADTSSTEKSDFEITALAVDNMYTNRGHASRILSAVAQFAREQEYKRIRTWIIGGDEQRARFFNACGFAPEGSRSELRTNLGTISNFCWVAHL